jgi:hypothetical protein
MTDTKVSKTEHVNCTIPKVDSPDQRDFLAQSIQRRTFVGLFSSLVLVSPQKSDSCTILSQELANSVDVGSIAGHLMHNQWGAWRTLPNLHEFIFKLGTRVGNSDFLINEEFELAYNLTRLGDVKVEELSYRNLNLIYEGLTEKLEYTTQLQDRLRSFAIEPHNHFTAQDLEEIKLIFQEPFSYSNCDGFPDIRNERDTPYAWFNHEKERIYKDKPLELVRHPFYRDFLRTKVRDGIKRIGDRLNDIKSVLSFVEQSPSSLLARIVMHGDDGALREILQRGKELFDGYCFPSSGCGGMVDRTHWIQRDELKPRLLNVDIRSKRGNKSTEDGPTTVAEERLNESSFRELRSCNYAFIFKYGSHIEIDSTQPMSESARLIISEVFSSKQNADNSTANDAHLEIYDFMMTSSFGDYRIVRHQPSFDQLLMSWIESKFGSTLILSNLVAAKSEKCVTLYDLWNQDPVDQTLLSDSKPNYKFLALEELISQQLSEDQFSKGLYTIEKKDRFGILLKKITIPNL